MAIFNQLSEEEIAKFTHYALFCGCVPIYFKDEGNDGCSMAVRNWWPDWLMPAVSCLFGLMCRLACMVNPDYEPMWAIKIQGEMYWPDDEGKEG